MPVCLAISHRLLLLSHDHTVHKLITFACSSSFRAPFKLLHSLPPSPKINSPFLHFAIKGDIPKGSLVVMKVLWGHALLTEVHYDCSYFVHFLSLQNTLPLFAANSH